VEDTLLGFYLPADKKSLRKQQLKSPKFCLFVPGVKRVLDRKLATASQLSAQEYGGAFEHFVLGEFVRLKSYYRGKLGFSYFKTRNSESADDEACVFWFLNKFSCWLAELLFDFTRLSYLIVTKIISLSNFLVPILGLPVQGLHLQEVFLTLSSLAYLCLKCPVFP